MEVDTTMPIEGRMEMVSAPIVGWPLLFRFVILYTPQALAVRYDVGGRFDGLTGPQLPVTANLHRYLCCQQDRRLACTYHIPSVGSWASLI